MKAIILLCFALIACSPMVAAISRTEILSLLQQNYSIDKVLQLFQALKAKEEQEKTENAADRDRREPQLAAEVTRTKGLVTDKKAACQTINTLLTDQDKEKSGLQDKANTATATIQDNKNKIKTAEDARCAANILYIGKLAQNQEAIDFLDYLSRKISDPSFKEYLSGNPGALVQIRQATSGEKNDELLSILTQHHLLALLQADPNSDYQGEQGSYDVKARTDQEVGTGHVDNTKGARQKTDITGTVYDTDEYVKQLVDYIKGLKDELKKSTEDFQKAEQASVQALIDYRNKLSDEIYVLTKFVEQTNQRVAYLDGVIANNQKALQECRDQTVPLEEGANLAKTQYDAYIRSNDEKKTSLSKTIELLDKVIEIYTNEVVNTAGTEYKKRSDDYLEDQVFDKTAGWTARETNQKISQYGR